MAKDFQGVMLASGSKGNAALISTDSQRFLLDVGISCRELVKRMQQVGASPEELDGVFVTHEHVDHVHRAAHDGPAHPFVLLRRGDVRVASDADGTVGLANGDCDAVGRFHHYALENRLPADSGIALPSSSLCHFRILVVLPHQHLPRLNIIKNKEVGAASCSNLRHRLKSLSYLRPYFLLNLSMRPLAFAAFCWPV